jgi:1,4-alpha-glucan branching enzyme
MPGDDWQRFANLRLLFTFQWTYPGKKLLFMGGEFAHPWEWDHRFSLPWELLSEPAHGGMRALVTDLNRLYREHPPLHRFDFDYRGFQWLHWSDADNSVLTYLRRDEEIGLVVALNLTPVPRAGYRIGVPGEGSYRELFNSDSRFYGGSDVGNPLPVEVESVPCMGQPRSIVVTLPPLAGIVLARC